MNERTADLIAVALGGRVRWAETIEDYVVMVEMKDPDGGKPLLLQLDSVGWQVTQGLKVLGGSNS